MNKKAMIEMMETFIIIFVVFILIGFGMYMFVKFSNTSTISEAQETCEMSSYQQLLTVLEQPGLKCTFMGSSKTRDCVDTAKLRAFIETGANEDLKNTACPMKVVFKQIYPKPNSRVNNTECTYNEMRSPEFPTSCGMWPVFVPSEKSIEGKAERVTSTPVSLYYPHIKQYGVGQLEITTYTYI